jgi:hypothetical protein
MDSDFYFWYHWAAPLNECLSSMNGFVGMDLGKKKPRAI